MPDKSHVYVGVSAAIATLVVLLFWPLITSTSVTGTKGVTTGI